MTHNLKISISKQNCNGIVNFKSMKIRERLLRLLLGKNMKLTIIVPGDTVSELAIQEIREGDVKA